jgi:ATP-dependent Zn protease
VPGDSFRALISSTKVGDKIAAKEEVQRILGEVEGRAYQLLKDRPARLDRLADALPERELDRTTWRSHAGC